MPRYANSGDTLTLPVGPDRNPVEMQVSPPCDDPNRGGWYCVAHDESFPNNMAATGHYANREAECLFVWLCVFHGPEAVE